MRIFQPLHGQYLVLSCFRDLRVSVIGNHTFTRVPEPGMLTDAARRGGCVMHAASPRPRLSALVEERFEDLADAIRPDSRALVGYLQENVTTW